MNVSIKYYTNQSFCRIACKRPIVLGAIYRYVDNNAHTTAISKRGIFSFYFNAVDSDGVNKVIDGIETCWDSICDEVFETINGILKSCYLASAVFYGGFWYLSECRHFLNQEYLYAALDGGMGTLMVVANLHAYWNRD